MFIAFTLINYWPISRQNLALHEKAIAKLNQIDSNSQFATAYAQNGQRDQKTLVLRLEENSLVQ